MNHADGSFIAHTPSSDEIDSAVRLLRRFRYTVVPPMGEGGSVKNPIALDLNWRTLTYGAKRIQLSPLQACIVQQLIDRSPGWCSRSQLRRALWGTTLPISDPLAVHMHYVREKLRDLTGRHALLADRKLGFRLAPELVERR